MHSFNENGIRSRPFTHLDERMDLSQQDIDSRSRESIQATREKGVEAPVRYRELRDITCGHK